MPPLPVSLFFLFLNVVNSYTNYIQLLGYTLKADTLSQFSTTDANDCAIECANTDNCIGFQMLYGTGSCNLLTMVRGYSFDVSLCAYYLKQSANVTITGRTLTSNIDVVLQNAVYNSQEACPDGWTNLNTTCYLDVPENTCNEYASFLEASFNDGCNIPLMNVTYSCPDSNFTLGSYTDGHYCIKIIPKWSADTDIGNLTLYEMANQYCIDQTGGYLASIHSQEENDDINAIQNSFEKQVPGVMIGMITNSNTATNSDDMYWLDGTDVSYTNYVEISHSYSFAFTLMTSTGSWNTNINPNLINRLFKYMACKQHALAIMAKL